jgi:hypothetical protein
MLASKNDEPFKYIDRKEFETTSKLEAKKIIAEWNRRGSLKNSINMKYKYVLISAQRIQHNDIIDKEIFFMTRSSC